MRVRRFGKSYAHPLVVLYAHKSDLPDIRVGVIAGLACGNAVRRNRAKRLMRVAINPLLPRILPGMNILLIARSPLPAANILQTREALINLLERADLLSHVDNV